MSIGQERHVVYVLTSEGGDIYSAMTEASVISLKHWNPKMVVTLVCDPCTLKRLNQKQDPVLKRVDHVKEVQTPDLSATAKNRFMKSSVGMLIEGPFLYLDSDTLVRGTLEPIWQLNRESDLSAAVNNSGATLDDQAPAHSRKVLHQHGWKMRNDGYYNSGIIWFSGTLLSQGFARKWHEMWQQSSRTSGHFDQPAFNACLADSDLIFSQLPIIYNAQFKRRPSIATNAGIWHYFSSYLQEYTSKHGPPTAIEKYLVDQMIRGDLDESKVILLAQENKPWNSGNFIHRWGVNFIEGQESSLSKNQLFWLQGRKDKAIRRWIADMVNAPVLKTKNKINNVFSKRRR